MDTLPKGHLVIVPAPDEPEDWVALMDFYHEVALAFSAAATPDDKDWKGASPSAILGWQTLVVAAVPALCTAFGAWLGSRNGRKVRIKIGDIEAEAQTQEQVEELLALAQKNSRKFSNATNSRR